MVPRPLDSAHLPAVIGICPHPECLMPIYEHGPVSLLDGPLMHVACAVDARRDHTPG